MTVLALGCASTSPQTPTPSSAAHVTETLVDAAVSTLSNEPDATAVAPAPAPAPVAITVGARREVPTPSPTVRITAPRANTTVRENRVELRLDVRNWRNADDANDHRHIHVVVDNNDYIRVDDPRRPVVLENLSEGTHVVRAFPGWETHESVKTDGALAVLVFHVGRATPNFAFNPRAPMLTYSRPKGANNGPASDHILLDFYLSNVPPGDLGAEGVRVRPTIDGTAFAALTAWQPHYIEHLAEGEHTIVLELLGRDGQLLAGPFNRAERRITVSRTAPPPPPATAPAAAAMEHAGH